MSPSETKPPPGEAAAASEEQRAPVGGRRRAAVASCGSGRRDPVRVASPARDPPCAVFAAAARTASAEQSWLA